MNPSSREEWEVLVQQYHARFPFPSGGDLLPLLKSSLQHNAPIDVEIRLAQSRPLDDVLKSIQFAESVYARHIHPRFSLRVTDIRIQEPSEFYPSFEWLSAIPASHLTLYIDDEFEKHAFAPGFSNATYFGSGHMVLEDSGSLSLTVLSHEMAHGILGAGHCKTIPVDDVNEENFCLADWCDMDEYCTGKTPRAYFCQDHAEELKNIAKRRS